MTERPILFSGPMVRAILAGKKTQTRRVMKVNPAYMDMHCSLSAEDRADNMRAILSGELNAPLRCPYGQPGDVLWVKSTHWMRPDKGCAVRCADLMGWLKDDPPEHEGRPFTQEYLDRHEWQKKPSIHMPRWASRIRLPLKSVRVERVQDISADDARAEGVDDGAFPVQRFQRLWDSINGKAYPWAGNPWVWVLEWPGVQA